MHVDCGYDVASHMLEKTSNGQYYGVADTHLVEDIPTLSVEVEGDFKDTLKQVEYLLRVGKWEGVFPGCD